MFVRHELVCKHLFVFRQIFRNQIAVRIPNQFTSQLSEGNLFNFEWIYKAWPNYRVTFLAYTVSNRCRIHNHLRWSRRTKVCCYLLFFFHFYFRLTLSILLVVRGYRQKQAKQIRYDSDTIFFFQPGARGPRF